MILSVAGVLIVIRRILDDEIFESIQAASYYCRRSHTITIRIPEMISLKGCRMLQRRWGFPRAGLFVSNWNWPGKRANKGRASCPSRSAGLQGVLSATALFGREVVPFEFGLSVVKGVHGEGEG